MNGAVVRTHELGQVDRQLRMYRDVMIIAPPFTGLSTFLTHLENHIGTSEHLQNYSPIYFDLRSYLASSIPSCTDVIRALLSTVSNIDIDQVTTKTDGYLTSALECLISHDSDLGVIFIIDNLQALPEDVARMLLTQLRVVSESRLDNGIFRKFLFILGGRGLDLRKLDPEKSSPFNTAEKIYLKDLDEEDSVELIKQRFISSQYLCSDRVARYIHYWTGGHPYLLEQVCSHLVFRTAPVAVFNSTITFGTVDKVIEIMCDEGGDHLLRQVDTSVENLSGRSAESLRDILNGARYDSNREYPPLRELTLQGLTSNSKSVIWQSRCPLIDVYLRRHPRMGTVADIKQFVPRRLFVNVEGYRILFELENEIREFTEAKLRQKYQERWVSSQ